MHASGREYIPVVKRVQYLLDPWLYMLYNSWHEGDTRIYGMDWECTVSTRLSFTVAHVQTGLPTYTAGNGVFTIILAGSDKRDSPYAIGLIRSLLKRFLPTGQLLLPEQGH